MLHFSSDEQKQAEEVKSKGGEIYQGSPLHTSFDSISTQTTATHFQQPQAGNQDCFHLTTRFRQEKRHEKKTKKQPNLGGERECEHTWPGCQSLCSLRWRAASQLHVCLGSLTWSEWRIKEPPVPSSRGLNISVLVQQHLISSCPGLSAGKASIQRPDLRSGGM